MAGSKRNLQFQTLTGGVMTGTTVLTSPVTNLQCLDDIGYQFSWTGSPVGTFQIQVSADYYQDAQGNVQNAGHWVPLTFTYLSGANTFTSATTIPTSVGSPIYLDLPLLSAPWLRAVYTNISGTGVLKMNIACKEV